MPTGPFTSRQSVRGSISCRVIPKTEKMAQDASLPYTQYYKVEDQR